MLRLHLGASRKQLANRRLAPLLTSEWIHLGEPDLLRADGREPSTVKELPNYIPFYYKMGNRLPFDDNRFSFVFSEHFFEHLFLDEACELFRECFRVMTTGGCMRVVVPDADLRTYGHIERAGHTNSDPRWIHPDKHKSRWSIYSLVYVLSQLGFRTRGVVYCDKFGTYHRDLPEQNRSFYATCRDLSFIDDTSYVLRFNHSLVVDAVKPG